MSFVHSHKMTGVSYSTQMLTGLVSDWRAAGEAGITSPTTECICLHSIHNTHGRP